MSNTEALRKAAESHAQYLSGFYVSEDVSAVKAREIAATLRSLAAALAQPAASGEPVAKVRRAHAGGRARSIGYQVCDLLPGANVQDGTMLYAAPQPAPARVPLADERLNAAGLDYALADSFSSSKAEWVAQDIADAFKAGARAAERHHGITAPGASDAQPTKAQER